MCLGIQSLPAWVEPLKGFCAFDADQMSNAAVLSASPAVTQGRAEEGNLHSPEALAHLTVSERRLGESGARNGIAA